MYQNISHDFKTPITVMKSYMEAYRDGVESESKTMEVMSEQLNKLEIKVHSLLYLNKLNYLSERRDNLNEQYDVSKIVYAAVDKFKVSRTDVEFVLDIDKKDTIYRGSADMWEAIIDNILNNFMRYAKKKVKITIKNKKIVLYGDNEYSYQLKKLFKLIDKEVEFICDDEADSGETKSVYDLLYEDVSELMVLNTKCIWENMVCKFPNSKFLEELGLRYISDFREINCMPDDAIRESYLDSKYGYQVDPLLGFTIIYPNSSKEYNQYHVLGNTDLKRNRILILGGSTSDMGMYENTKSWPEILYEKLLAKDEVVLFGGAVGGYNSRQECLKLLRDIAIIKPNLVISYSGVNDAYPMNVESHPFYNSSVLAACKNAIKQYDTCIGSRTVETSAQLWIRMEQTMHAITTCFGGKFIGILQPTIHNKNELYGLERVIKVYQDGHGHEPFSYINNKKRNDSFKESVQISHCFEESYMHDFSDVLKEQEEVFKDVCHLLQAGNEVVAQRIYEVIETYIN